jgi:hypothetical protein
MAAKGVLRDGEAVGQEDEAEEGGERCEAFHGPSTMVLLGSPPRLAHMEETAGVTRKAGKIEDKASPPDACRRKGRLSAWSERRRARRLRMGPLKRGRKRAWSGACQCLRARQIRGCGPERPSSGCANQSSGQARNNAAQSDRGRWETRQSILARMATTA